MPNLNINKICYLVYYKFFQQSIQIILKFKMWIISQFLKKSYNLKIKKFANFLQTLKTTKYNGWFNLY